MIHQSSNDSNNLKQFLLQLVSDPMQAVDFRRSPQDLLQASGLSTHHQDALQRREESQMRFLTTDVQPSPIIMLGVQTREIYQATA